MFDRYWISLTSPENEETEPESGIRQASMPGGFEYAATLKNAARNVSNNTTWASEGHLYLVDGGCFSKDQN
jgi:hypothetical protein